MRYGYYRVEEEKARQAFGVKKFPTVVTFHIASEEGGTKMLEFTGPLNDYKYLFYFIEDMSLPAFLKRDPKIDEDDMEEVSEFTSRSFDKECIKKGGLCVISMFDGAPDPQSKQYKVLKKAQALMSLKNLPFRFGWVDGICQYELRDKMGISEVALPNLAVYFVNKKMASRLVGKFVKDDLTEFLNIAMTGKSNMFDYPGIQIVDRDCDALRQDIPEDEEDDELVKEILSQSEKKTDVKSGKQRRKRKKRGKGDL